MKKVGWQKSSQKIGTKCKSRKSCADRKIVQTEKSVCGQKNRNTDFNCIFFTKANRKKSWESNAPMPDAPLCCRWNTLMTRVIVDSPVAKRSKRRKHHNSQRLAVSVIRYPIVICTLRCRSTETNVEPLAPPTSTYHHHHSMNRCTKSLSSTVRWKTMTNDRLYAKESRLAENAVGSFLMQKREKLNQLLTVSNVNNCWNVLPVNEWYRLIQSPLSTVLQSFFTIILENASHCDDEDWIANAINAFTSSSLNHSSVNNRRKSRNRTWQTLSTANSTKSSTSLLFACGADNNNLLNRSLFVVASPQYEYDCCCCRRCWLITIVMDFAKWLTNGFANRSKLIDGNNAMVLELSKCCCNRSSIVAAVDRINNNRNVASQSTTLCRNGNATIDRFSSSSLI